MTVATARRIGFGRVLRSPWLWIVAAGYLLRIALMPLTGQHDVMFMPWMTHFINLGHPNLYAYLYDAFGERALTSPGVWAPYPYGFYALTAGWLELLDKLHLVDLAGWNSIWIVAHPARSVFLFKLLYLPFDLAIAYLLYRTVGPLGPAVWAWSPTALYTPFMMGQNDIYPTFFAVAGVYSAVNAVRAGVSRRTHNKWIPSNWALASSVMLGMGSVFKLYPIFLLPPLILIVEKGWRRRAVLLGTGSSFLVVATLPFINTPAFVRGVLFNPEGAQILRGIELFGVPVPLFGLCYVALMAFLLLAEGRFGPEPLWPWSVAVLVIASLLLWSPIMIYWLIWITPLAIGLTRKASKGILAWLVIQLAFVFLLLDQHRELGVALPIHLAPVFNLPNLRASVAIRFPGLSGAYSAYVPFGRTLLVTSLLVSVYFSMKTISAGPATFHRAFRRRWWIFLPAFLLISGLLTSMFFARVLVSRNISYDGHNLELEMGDIVSQEIVSERESINGVRLRSVPRNPEAKLKVCLFGQAKTSLTPLACASRDTTDLVEGDALYFTFERPVEAERGGLVHITIEVLEGGQAIVLPYTTSQNLGLKANGEPVNGSLIISALSTFTVGEAASDLVAKNIVQDAPLSLIIATIAALITGLVGIFVWRNMSLDASEEKSW